MLRNRNSHTTVIVRHPKFLNAKITLHFILVLSVTNTGKRTPNHACSLPCMTSACNMAKVGCGVSFAMIRKIAISYTPHGAARSILMNPGVCVVNATRAGRRIGISAPMANASTTGKESRNAITARTVTTPTAHRSCSVNHSLSHRSGRVRAGLEPMQHQSHERLTIWEKKLARSAGEKDHE